MASTKYRREYERYIEQFYNEPSYCLQRSRKRDRLWREDIERECQRYEAEYEASKANQIFEKIDVGYELNRRILTMISRKIKITTYCDIKDFVSLASKYGEGLIIKKGSYTFPACSLMSLLSLVDVSDGCKIYFADYDLSDIEKDFTPWIVSEE